MGVVFSDAASDVDDFDGANGELLGVLWSLAEGSRIILSGSSSGIK